MQMKKKFFNLTQYLHKAWQTSRSYLLFTIIRNIFSAMVSLIGVVGLGIVINSIVEKKTRSEIILTIVILLIAIVIGIIAGKFLYEAMNGPI